MIPRATLLTLVLTLIIAVVGVVSEASAQIILTACGSLGTGNYVLANNITQAGTCFTVTGNNVALDLQRHTLTGNGTGAGVTDNATTFTAIIISNGTIKHFNIGIDLSHSNPVTIDKMTVTNNVSHGVSTSTFTSVTATQANQNGGDGITNNNGAISHVANSTATGNTGIGINIGGCCSAVTDSTANNNKSTGISVTGCCSSVAQSSAKKNTGDGIFMSGSLNTVSDSKSAHNGGKGIVINDSDSHVAQSSAKKNTGDGIFSNSCCNTVSDSKSSNNKGNGIFLTADDNSVSNAQANSNDLTGLTIACPSNVNRLTAKNNVGGNLVEGGGICTNLNNNAP